MNPRIPVIGVVGAFAVVILIIAYSGTSVIDDTSGEARLGSSGGATVIEPLVIELNDIIIEDVDERTAFVEISFKVTNPNYKSVILEMIRYNAVSYTHLTLPTSDLV